MNLSEKVINHFESYIKISECSLKRDFFDLKEFSFTKDYFISILEMTSYHLKFPEVRLVKNGETIEERYIVDSTYTHKKGFVKYLSVEKIWRLFDKGATIIVNSIDRLEPTLFSLSKKLTEHFQCTVKINCYYTPAFSSGIDFHYDSHDVILIQIFGDKEWTLAPATIINPLPEDSSFDQDLPKKPFQKKTLNAGDALYIPRGVWHCGKTKNNQSLHITIGIHFETYIDIIRKNLFSNLKNNELARSKKKSGFNSDHFINELNDFIIKSLEKYNNEVF